MQNIEELKERRKEAWKEYKSVRYYARPIFHGQFGAAIGVSSPRLLNPQGFQLLYQFREAQKNVTKALMEKENG